MIRGLLNLVIGLWNWLRSFFVRPDRALRTTYADELPERLDRDCVYVLGEGQHRWFVAMLCPCGCGATLQMSLLADAHPRWGLIEHGDDGTVSLHPSVWRQVDCQSHFFLRRGRIVWC
jgi:hypothetical protein